MSLAETIPLTYHSAAYVTLSEKKNYLFYVLQLILHAITRDMSCITLCSVRNVYVYVHGSNEKNQMQVKF